MKTILNINYFKLLIITILFLPFTSCDEVGEGTDPGGTSVQDMAGDWYVELLYEDEDIYGIGYNLLSTYNTASNDGTQMWIDDHELWPTKVKANVDYSNKTFFGDMLLNYDDENQPTGPEATITNGRIVKDGATTSGGNTSDLIEFDIEWADDPGTVYTMRGYKRTGFPEDEH